MGTNANDSGTMAYRNTYTLEEKEQGISTSVTLSEDALIEKMENIVLKCDGYQDSIANGDGGKDVGVFEKIGLLPLRPYAGNCPHYVRTGSCKFGLKCRYNHPVKKSQQGFEGSDTESEKIGKIECKYFSTAGGCKYGKSCRYSHPGEESKNRVPELNTLGLPMRLGEKECRHYMLNGFCGYGSHCVYHHPDPTSLAGKDSPTSIDEKFGARVVSLSENSNGGSLHLLGASKSYQAQWSTHKLSDNVGPYSENHSSQLMGKQSQRNGYQASRCSIQSKKSYSTPVANGPLRKTDVCMQVDEFPVRPGQPECDYFMKTGNCKFKFTCRFDHPKDRTSKLEECVLNENGLPSRPGRSICRHYERLGLCKFGSACLFDHPANRELFTNPDWPSTTETAVDCDSGSWKD